MNFRTQTFETLGARWVRESFRGVGIANGPTEQAPPNYVHVVYPTGVEVGLRDHCF